MHAAIERCAQGAGTSCISTLSTSIAWTRAQMGITAVAQERRGALVRYVRAIAMHAASQRRAQSAGTPCISTLPERQALAAMALLDRIPHAMPLPVAPMIRR